MRTQFNTKNNLYLKNQVLEGHDFSGRKLDLVRSEACAFTRCDFSRMQVKDMVFASGSAEILYRSCTFDESKFNVSTVGPARFQECSFRNVDIRDMLCSAAEFVDCVFSGFLRGCSFSARVAPLYLNDINRSKNEFRGNDFSKAVLADASFTGGIDISKQILPAGENYLFIRNATEKVKVARGQIVVNRDMGLRSTAMAMVKTLEVLIAGGQEDLFLTKDTFNRLDSAAVDMVFSLLGS